MSLVFDGPTVRRLIADGIHNKNFKRIPHYVNRTERGYLAMRLAKGISSADEGQCWLWNKIYAKDGYGRITINRKSQLAHRVSYFARFGIEIPNGVQVLHACDTPACINPDHLHLGTQLMNMHEMRERGRDKRPWLPGSKNGQARLTESDIPKILTLIADGETMKTIGGVFGVTATQICRIGRGKGWKHVHRSIAESLDINRTVNFAVGEQ